MADPGCGRREPGCGRCHGPTRGGPWMIGCRQFAGPADRVHLTPCDVDHERVLRWSFTGRRTEAMSEPS